MERGGAAATNIVAVAYLPSSNRNVLTEIAGVANSFVVDGGGGRQVKPSAAE